MKIVLKDDREFKFINKFISMIEENNIMANIIASSYNRSIRSDISNNYGKRFIGISTGGDTIPYVCILMNYLIDLLNVKSDKAKFNESLFMIKKLSNDFENAYRRWYHVN